MTAPSGTTDPNTTNNSADTDTAALVSDLAITKTDNVGGSSITGSTGAYTPGSTLTYTITVHNAGNVTLTNLQLANPTNGSTSDPQVRVQGILKIKELIGLSVQVGGNDYVKIDDTGVSLSGLEHPTPEIQMTLFD